MKEKKEKKTTRINLRVVPELDTRVKELAKSLQLSKNKVIENAMWSYVLDTQKFINCPECHLPIYEKEYLPIWEGASYIECTNGHKNIYDFENERFVFGKEDTENTQPKIFGIKKIYYKE